MTSSGYLSGFASVNNEFTGKLLLLAFARLSFGYVPICMVDQYYEYHLRYNIMIMFSGFNPLKCEWECIFYVRQE